MNIREILRAPCGRTLAGTVALASFSAALIGTGGASVPPLAAPLVVLLSVVASIIAVGMAVQRFPGFALVLLLVLPLLGGLYFAGLTVVDRAGPVATSCLVALGLVAAWSSATGASLHRE